MSFTSWTFLLFLPTICTAYWLLPVRRLRSIFLLAASFFFYGWIQPRLCLLLLVAALVAWAGAYSMAAFPARRRMALVGGLVALLGLLTFFKYTQFVAGLLQDTTGWLAIGGIWAQAINAVACQLDDLLRAAYRFLGLEAGGSRLLPPLGISFFTFQCAGYLADVYRGQIHAERSPSRVLLFVSFFPQLVAGPIERAGHLLPQLFDNTRRFSFINLQMGLPLILRGLLKKMVLADNLAPLVDRVFQHNTPGIFLLYAGTFAFALQIYGDFSGYTDIARGVARLFGIDLMENFRAPYASLTPADFWRRWHISFSLWIRDYLYFPLGGSRRGGSLRLLAVLLLTFGLSGLWHGAALHFIVWGLYFGVLLWFCHVAGIHKRGWTPQGRTVWTRTIKRFMCWLLTLHLILVGWLLFRTPDLQWLRQTLQNGTLESVATLHSPLMLFGASAFYALPLVGWWLLEQIRTPWLRGVMYGLLFGFFLAFARGTEYDFIYFRF